MSNKKRKTTEKEKEIDNDLEIFQQYDADILVGESWKRIFHEILNKRFADGWKYIPPFYKLMVDTSIADSQGNHEIHYYVLYERIISDEEEKAMNQIKFSSGRLSNSSKNAFSMD